MRLAPQILSLSVLAVVLEAGCGAVGGRPRGALDARRVTLLQLPEPLRYDPRSTADVAAQQVARQLRKASFGCPEAWVRHDLGESKVAASFGPGCSSKGYDHLEGAIVLDFNRDPDGLVLNYDFNHVAFNSDSIDGGGFGASSDGALLVAWGRVAQWHDDKFVLPPPPEEETDGFWHWENAPPEYKQLMAGLEMIIGAVIYILYF